VQRLEKDDLEWCMSAKVVAVEKAAMVRAAKVQAAYVAATEPVKEACCGKGKDVGPPPLPLSLSSSASHHLSTHRVGGDRDTAAASTSRHRAAVMTVGGEYRQQ
jgi:hypothetical protein